MPVAAKDDKKPVARPAATAKAATGAATSPAKGSTQSAAATGVKASVAVKPAAAGSGTKASGGAAPGAPKAAAKAPTGTTAKPAAAGKAAPGTKGKAKAPCGGSGPPAAAAAPTAEPARCPAADSDAKAEAESVKRQAAADAEMEALRQAAWQAQVEYERKQEAKRQKKREEEARRKKEEASLRKALLEAAYDGEDGELDKLMAKASSYMPDVVETADAHGNTLLSEAAAGGALSTVQKLLQLGADPNSQGEFKRTPLWRAAFLGHEGVVPVLLQGGADPRIGNDSGELPVHVAGNASIGALLGEWDTAHTDTVAAQIEERKVAKAAAAATALAQAVRSAEQEVELAEEEHGKCQQALKHARMELEKRIFEHDICVGEQKSQELIQATLDQIHVQERAVPEAKRRADEAQEAMDAARLRLREQQAEQDAAAAEELPGMPVEVKALNDVLLRDVGGKLHAAGRWPLVIDASGQASVFLRYQDTNYVNALNARHVEPHMLRRALLGAIRYGKPLVVDMMEVDMWSELGRLADQVQPGLLSSLLDKSLLSANRFHSLIRPDDGEEYEPNRFLDDRVKAFRLIVLTANRKPHADMLQRLYPIRVLVKGG